MVSAYMSGFTDRNYLSLAELHRIIENRCQDKYNIGIPNIEQRYGKNMLEILSNDFDGQSS